MEALHNHTRCLIIRTIHRPTYCGLDEKKIPWYELTVSTKLRRKSSQSILSIQTWLDHQWTDSYL